MNRKLTAQLLVAGFVFHCVDMRANPRGLTVVSGTAHTTQQGHTLQITTSRNAVLNWNSFNIGFWERRRSFTNRRPHRLCSTTSITRIRQRYFGSLQCERDCYFGKSRGGFYFGPHAFVKAGGLIVTTAAINPWASGGGAGWSFDGTADSGAIVHNYGKRLESSSSGGSLFLIGHDIENHGSLSAPGGTAALLARQEVLLTERPNGTGNPAPVQVARLEASITRAISLPTRIRCFCRRKTSTIAD